MVYFSPQSYPKYIQWFITGACNSKCNHCNVLGTPLVDGELERISEHIAVIGNIDIPVSALEFIGGEPLCQRGLEEIIATAHGHGLRTLLATNGLALDPFGQHAQMLAAIHSIAISIDGINPRSYESMRGVDAFHKVIGVLNSCLSLLGPDRIRVVYVMAKPTHVPARSILGFFYELGVRNLAINNLQLSVANQQSVSDLTLTCAEKLQFWEDVVLHKDDFKPLNVEFFMPPLFYDYIEQRHGIRLQMKYTGCRAVSSDLAISPDGRLWPCSMFYEHTNAYAELLRNRSNCLKTRRASVILHEGVFQSVLKSKAVLDFPGYNPCDRCGHLGSTCFPCYLRRETRTGAVFALCQYIMALSANSV